MFKIRESLDLINPIIDPALDSSYRDTSPITYTILDKSPVAPKVNKKQERSLMMHNHLLDSSKNDNERQVSQNNTDEQPKSKNKKCKLKISKDKIRMFEKSPKEK